MPKLHTIQYLAENKNTPPVTDSPVTKTPRFYPCLGYSQVRRFDSGGVSRPNELARVSTLLCSWVPATAGFPWTGFRYHGIQDKIVVYGMKSPRDLIILYVQVAATAVLHGMGSNQDGTYPTNDV